MDLTSLDNQISEFRDTAQPHADLGEAPLEKLCGVFRQIDDAMSECDRDDDACDERATGLIEAQDVILRLAAATPARTTRDILCKLAMWRWDAAELDQPMEDMNRADAIVYSAFIDLARMLGERDVLKDFDKAD